ncbi:hypothetical protein BpHYR1_027519 [Brachionus plicatilis]|uniref:Uncharacterized protein n=1 Tax=Brachionus plicatilis TaxID=10195 RepID=A0A3M7RZ35_BRAPC|nr:hypothetical protein BpHYR1_027519 [Brachionus plicatilis]
MSQLILLTQLSSLELLFNNKTVFCFGFLWQKLPAAVKSCQRLIVTAKIHNKMMENYKTNKT